MDNNEEYAKLLSSVKTANTGFRRPLSPIQTAEYIQRLIDEEGSENAELMLPLAKTLISNFLRLLELPEQCHNAIIWGETKDFAVGFSAASFIARLKQDDDKLLLFLETSKQNLIVTEITKITTFYAKNDLSLLEAIEKITSVRPKIIHSYLVVISIQDDVKKKLEEFSTKLNKTWEQIMCDKLAEKFGIKNVDSIIMKGNNVVVTLEKNQYLNYKKHIKELGLEYDKITEYLVKEH